MNTLRDIREAAELSITHAAERLGVSKQAWRTAEARATKGTITLRVLGEYAAALDHRLEYKLVPTKNELNKSVRHSMMLENQSIPEDYKFNNEALPEREAKRIGIELGLTELQVGLKYDTGKLAWHLLPLKPIKEIVKVLMFGAEKYGVANWQELDNPRDRYWDACVRHLTNWKLGERVDPETGYSHLAHAGCCIVFLLWFELEPMRKKIGSFSKG